MNQLNAIVTLKRFSVDILNEYAPFKKKLLRANHAPYKTKRLRKAIMKRSKLKSKYLKIQTQNHLNHLNFAVGCIKMSEKSNIIQ